MSVARMLGIPCPDKDGTFHIKVEEIGGEVRLSVNGDVFAKCLVKGRDAKIQILDIDTGIVCEHNIASLCWRR